MRLISCHVENFGKLSDFSFDFNPGVNNIMQDNGWGKSTLAAFIRVMFFGFDRDSKRGELQNERKRYAPWQSGVYGGEIEFEQNGKSYKIDRKFSSRKADDDYFSVIDCETNKATDKFSQNIGEELFGIDAESFEKTVFVAQQDCETVLTESIHSKIGDIAGQTAGMGNYKTVMKNLKTEELRLNPSKKDSEISMLEKKLSELKKIINNREKYSQSHEMLSADLEKLAKEDDECRQRQKEIQKELKELSRLSDLKLVYEKYKNLQDTEDKAKSAWEKIASNFPGKAPSQSEIDENLNRANELKALEYSISTAVLTDEQAKRLEVFKKEFASGIPENEDLRIASALISKINEQKVETEASRLSDDEADELARYKERFNSYEPTEEETKNFMTEWDKRNSDRHELTLMKGKAAAIKSSPLPESYSENASVIPKKMLVLGIVLLLVAFLLSILRSPVVLGVSVAFVGAILVALSFVLGHKDEKYEANRKILAEEERKGEIEKVLADICLMENAIAGSTHRVEEFLIKVNGNFNEGTASDELVGILTDLKIYEGLKSREGNYNQAKSKLNKSDVENKIREFFSMYMELSSDDYVAMLQQLNFDKKEYLELNDIALQKVNNTEKYKLERKKLSDFIRSAGFDEEDDLSLQISRMRDDLCKLQKANMDYNSARTDRQVFESSNDIEALRDFENITFDDGSMEKLSSEFNSLSERREELDKDSREGEDKLDEIKAELKAIDEAESEYNKLSAERDALRHKYEIIIKTEVFLARARDSFAEKYMSPIRLAYDKYYSMLSDDDKEYELDANLNITVKEYGKKHETGFLSEGYKDLVGLCRRMAMIEAMYEGEKPFVILDDPFVNLDDSRIEGAKAFLNDIGKNFQIIYFTCNQYRAAQTPSIA